MTKTALKNKPVSATASPVADQNVTYPSISVNYTLAGGANPSSNAQNGASSKAISTHSNGNSATEVVKSGSDSGTTGAAVQEVTYPIKGRKKKAAATAPAVSDQSADAAVTSNADASVTTNSAEVSTADGTMPEMRVVSIKPKGKGGRPKKAVAEIEATSVTNASKIRNGSKYNCGP